MLILSETVSGPDIYWILVVGLVQSLNTTVGTWLWQRRGYDSLRTKEGWPCNRESFSEFNSHSTEVPTFPFLAFLVPGCNRQAQEINHRTTVGYTSWDKKLEPVHTSYISLVIAESPVIYCLYVSGGDSGDVAINNMSHLWTHRSFLLVSLSDSASGSARVQRPVKDYEFKDQMSE